jgi:hypothetical protein
VEIEQRKMGKNSSNFYGIMSEAVLKKASFHKWLRKEDKWTVDELPVFHLKLTTFPFLELSNW